MLNVNKIMYELKSNILSSRICISADTKMQGVMFLEKNTVLEKGYIYITDLYTMKEFEFVDGSETEVLFLCYGITDGVIEGIGTDISWAYSSLTVEKLYNALHGLFRREDKRQAYFETIMRESRPLDRLMKWIHEELKITAVLLDSSLEIMASVWDERHFKEPFVQQIRKTRKIDNEMFSQYFGVFLQNQKLTDSWAEFECSSEKGRVYRIQIDKYFEQCYLIVIGDLEENEVYQIDEFIEYIKVCVTRNNIIRFTTNHHFSVLINDILSHRLVTDEQIDERQEKLPPMRYGNRYCFLLISPDEQTSRGPIISELMNILKQFFVYCEITAYERDILIFLNHQDTNRRIRVDLEKLNKFCHNYGYYAAIGGNSEFLSAVNIIYQHAKETIRLGTVLCEKPDQRVFDYENYCIYLFIEMLSNGLFERYHKDQLFYLCHQSALRLARYDDTEKTDLLLTLQTYIENNCSTMAASKKLFVHRNTLLKKLNSIEEIIGDNIEKNSNLQERILFSCHVIKYVRVYQKKNIFPKYEK